MLMKRKVTITMEVECSKSYHMHQIHNILRNALENIKHSLFRVKVVYILNEPVEE